MVHLLVIFLLEQKTSICLRELTLRIRFSSNFFMGKILRFSNRLKKHFVPSENVYFKTKHVLLENLFGGQPLESIGNFLYQNVNWYWYCKCFQYTMLSIDQSIILISMRCLLTQHHLTVLLKCLVKQNLGNR